MRINNMNSLNFKRKIKIIDAHTHDKPFNKLGLKADSDDILKFLNKPMQSQNTKDTFVVTKMFPSSLDCCFMKQPDIKPYADEIKGNEAILKTFEGTKVKEFLAVCQPKTGSVDNIRQLFKNNPDKFIGLKFHPEGLELEADSELYDSYLQFAKEKNIPCLFHSDRTNNHTYPDGTVVAKSKYSTPEQIYNLAKRHPDVPVVMAHFGGPEKEDIEAAVDVIMKGAKNNDAKLYADLSWVDIDNYTEGKRKMQNIIDAIKKLKNSPFGDLTNRIMFGTDAPIDRFNQKDAQNTYENYIKDIYSAIKKSFGSEADNIADNIFYKNANNLFFQNTAKKLLKTKGIIAAIVTGVLACGGIGILIYNKCQNKK